MKQRNEAIDILKGIGILLVLVAHALGGFVSHFSYTFHMPLFFIVSGLYIEEYQADSNTPFPAWWQGRAKKDLKRLLLPALFTTGLILSLSCLYYVCNDTILRKPLDIIWKSNPVKLGANLIIPGNMWFLFALFFAKQFFYLLRYCFKGLAFPFVCFCSGGASVIVGQEIQFPFCILIAVSVLPLLWEGYYLKVHGGIEKGLPKWYNYSIILWVLFVFFGGLGVNSMSYTWGYIGDLIAASGGTLLAYYVSKLILVKTIYLRKILSFLGIYSIILVCTPGIETYLFPMQDVIPQIPYRMIFVLLAKVIWCVVSLYACIKIPFLKRIFIK